MVSGIKIVTIRSMPMSPEFLTKQGYKKLEEELEHLRTTKRREVAARLHEAAESSLGEFVEDPEFEAAKNEQSFVEGRIRELELLLANAQVITKSRKKNGVVEVGNTVVIKEGRRNPEEYLIVGAAEANPREGKISHESPLGSALLGAKPGDKVEVSAPSGAFTVKIVEVK
jgi:transcription elongation factor GreA